MDQVHQPICALSRQDEIKEQTAGVDHELSTPEERAALDGFTFVMGVFVLPIIALTLLLVVVYEVGLRRGRAQAVTRDTGLR